MRVVLALDWSEQAFNAVRAVTRLYTPEELTLLHAVDLRLFRAPLLTPPIAKQAFEEIRQALVEAGDKLLDQAAGLVPPGPASITRLVEIGAPAEVILDTVQAVHADLVAVGARGRSQLTELMLGSVSHRVLMHAACSVLVMKRSLSQLRRALVAVEGPDDAERIVGWLRAYPFKQAVDLSVINVVPKPHVVDPVTIPALEPWEEAAIASAQDLVRDVATVLQDAGYKATGRALSGDPAQVIATEAADYDLLAVGSHGRKGLQRFLLGSVSHAVTRSAPCPVLVIRSLTQ